MQLTLQTSISQVMLIDGLYTENDPAKPFPRVMVRYCLYSLILFHLWPGWQIYAQAPRSTVQETDSLIWYIQKEYGLNQELINGVQFYQRYSQCEGDPYFPADIFYEGVLYPRGGDSHQVQMKYDIFAQQLVMGYTDYSNRYNQVIIDSIRIDSFIIGKYLFKKINLSDIKPMFYHVYGSGQVSCFTHWSKEMIPISFRGQYTHKFSDPEGTFFLLYKGQARPFQSRKTFISLLPATIQPELRKYFKQKKIRIGNATADEIGELINFVNSKLELEPYH